MRDQHSRAGVVVANMTSEFAFLRERLEEWHTDRPWLAKQLDADPLDVLRGIEEQLEATRSALHDLAEECFERMAAADLEAWDAPYRIEYPGDLVERARAVLNPASRQEDA